MDEYIGIVKLFAGNFAPKNWMFCHGQILSIAQNTALFSILGTTYGGNGQTTFGLPDLRCRVPLGAGQGPGLRIISPGEMAGTENVTLNVTNMPMHTHGVHLKASSTNATDSAPKTTSVLGAPGKPAGRQYENTYGYVDATPDITLSEKSIQMDAAGGSLPFSIVQPYTGMNYIICIYGLFPPRD
jgi:microcystin-dependent protein